MTGPLLTVEDLRIQFRTDEGIITTVDGISFDIAPGEVMGLVGESGSGKSVSAKSLMQLNASNTIYGEERPRHAEPGQRSDGCPESDEGQ